MRKLLFCILTSAALSLAAGKPPTVASVKAMSYFDLQTELTDNEKLLLAKARNSVSGTLDVLIQIHEKRLPKLRAEDEQADQLVFKSYTKPLNDVYLGKITNTPEERERLIENRRQTLARVMLCQDTITAMKDFLQKRGESTKKRTASTEPVEKTKPEPVGSAIEPDITVGSVKAAQTKQETMDYIVRESMEAPRSYNRSENSFTNAGRDQALYFKKHWLGLIGDDEGVSHECYIPIDNVDFFIAPGRYGYTLRAKRRSGPHAIVTSSKGEELSWTETTVLTTDDEVKVQKLLRAFNHLIELETGRKELF